MPFDRFENGKGMTVLFLSLRIRLRKSLSFSNCQIMVNPSTALYFRAIHCLLAISRHSASISLSRIFSVTSHLRNFLTWESIQKFYNNLPLGVCACKSKYDAQMYTAFICVVIGCIVLPLLFVGFGLIFYAKK